MCVCVCVCVCVRACACVYVVNIVYFSQSPDDAPDLPVLELDLGWELPDFAVIGELLLVSQEQQLVSALHFLK